MSENRKPAPLLTRSCERVPMLSGNAPTKAKRSMNYSSTRLRSFAKLAVGSWTCATSTFNWSEEWCYTKARLPK